MPPSNAGTGGDAGPGFENWQQPGRCQKTEEARPTGSVGPADFGAVAAGKFWFFFWNFWFNFCLFVLLQQTFVGDNRGGVARTLEPRRPAKHRNTGTSRFTRGGMAPIRPSAGRMRRRGSYPNDSPAFLDSELHQAPLQRHLDNIGTLLRTTGVSLAPTPGPVKRQNDSPVLEARPGEGRQLAIPPRHCAFEHQHPHHPIRWSAAASRVDRQLKAPTFSESTIPGAWVMRWPGPVNDRAFSMGG